MCILVLEIMYNSPLEMFAKELAQILNENVSRYSTVCPKLMLHGESSNYLLVFKARSY